MDAYTHIEILVEDISGQILVNKVMAKYVGTDTLFSYRIHGFKGIGILPDNVCRMASGKTSKLLNDLPQYLKGLDASLKSYTCKTAIFVILDCDDKDCSGFKTKLTSMSGALNLSTEVHFCIAVEEVEAWLLGDEYAIVATYPEAKVQLLHKYKQDSIIGTWEYLADVVYSGGIKQLKKNATTYYEIGKVKCEWAEKIGDNLDIRNNMSPSFNYFLKKLDSTKAC